MANQLKLLGGTWHVVSDDPALRTIYGGSQQSTDLTAKTTPGQISAPSEAKHPGKTFVIG